MDLVKENLLLQLPSPESDELLVERKTLTSLASVHFRHDAQYNTLSAQTKVMERAYKEGQRRLDFHEGQYRVLQEQDLLLKERLPGLSLAPHPMCYGPDLGNQDSRYMNHMMVTDCALCTQPFPFNDIIVAHCRHLYHPWCAVTHFRKNYTCADPDCPTIMSADWQKRVGYREIDFALFDSDVLERSEDSRLTEISTRKQAALAMCPEAGSSLKPFIETPSKGTPTGSVGQSSGISTQPKSGDKYKKKNN